MSAKRPTQSDVAKRAGVSRGTVSLVLNNQANGRVPISEETQQRVREAAAELGYTPNPVAQMLVQGSNMLMGVFSYEMPFPYDEGDFFFPYLLGIQRAAIQNEYNVLLFTRSHRDGAASIYSEGMNGLHLADGSVLLGGDPDREELRRLADEGYPFVYIGRREVPGAEISWVANDYQQGSYDITGQLLELGHRHIAFVAGSLHLEHKIDKLKGVQQAVTTWAAQDGHVSTIEDGLLHEPARFVAHIREQGITAILTDDSKGLLGVLAICAQHGIAVPQELSVASLVSVDHPHLFDIRPTYVHLNRHQVGETAAQILVERLLGLREIQQVLIPCRVVEGDSIGPAPKMTS